MATFNFSTVGVIAGAAVLIQLLLNLTVLSEVPPPYVIPIYPITSPIASVVSVDPPTYIDPDLIYLGPDVLNDKSTLAMWDWVHGFQPQCTTTCAALFAQPNPYNISYVSFTAGFLDGQLNFTGATNTLYCFDAGVYQLNNSVHMNSHNYFIGCPNSIVYVTPPGFLQLVSVPTSYIYFSGLTYDFSFGTGYIGHNYAWDTFVDQLIVYNCTFANLFMDYPLISLNNVALIFDNLFYNVSYALGPASGGGAHSISVYNNVFYNVQNYLSLGWFGSQGFTQYFVFNNNTIIMDEKMLHGAYYNQIINLEGYVMSPFQMRNNRISCQRNCASWLVINYAGDNAALCPVGNFTLGWITNNSLIVNNTESTSMFSDFGPLTGFLVKNNSFEIVGNSARGFPFALETISSVLFVNNTFIGNSLGGQMNAYGTGGSPSPGYNVCGGVLPIESMNTFGTNYFYDTVALTWRSFNGSDYKGGTQWPPSTCGNSGTFVPCCHPYTPALGMAICRCGTVPYYGNDPVSCQAAGDPPSNLQISYYFGLYFGIAFTATNADTFSIVINNVRQDNISTNYAIVKSLFNVTVPPTGPVTLIATIIAENKFGQTNGTIPVTIS